MQAYFYSEDEQGRLEEAWQDGFNAAYEKINEGYNAGYAQGQMDLIKQFDQSSYLIIHVSEYGDVLPSCYNLCDIAKKLKEQNNDRNN